MEIAGVREPPWTEVSDEVEWAAKGGRMIGRVMVSRKGINGS